MKKTKNLEMVEGNDADTEKNSYNMILNTVRAGRNQPL